jgi:hypothetical protein
MFDALEAREGHLVPGPPHSASLDMDLEGDPKTKHNPIDGTHGFFYSQLRVVNSKWYLYLALVTLKSSVR